MRSWPSSDWTRRTAAALLSAPLLAAAWAFGATEPSQFAIRTVSTRANTVSGGDVLVEVLQGVFHAAGAHSPRQHLP